MITRNLLLTVAVGGLFMTGCGGGRQSQVPAKDKAIGETPVRVMEKSIDLTASSVNWAGKMLGMYEHSGSVGLSAATLSEEGNRVIGGSFTVDLSTIIPLDENYDPSKGHSREKLVEHLSSPDFFDVASHPTATFVVTGSSEDGSSVTGNLTIRGNTSEERVENVVVSDGSVTGTLTFDRTGYDVSFTHPIKDMVISDDIVLEIDLKVVG